MHAGDERWCLIVSPTLILTEQCYSLPHLLIEGGQQIVMILQDFVMGWGQAEFVVQVSLDTLWGQISLWDEVRDPWNTWNGRNLTNEISWDKETMMGFSEIKKICMEWKQTWNLLQCPRSCIWNFETICSSRPHWLNLGQMVASPLPSHRILSLLDCFNVQNRSSRTNK